MRGLLLAAAGALAALANAQLNPASFPYCNMDPEASYPIPTINPAGKTLQQLQVFIRHGDRLRAAAPPPCWPADDVVYDCEMDVALATSQGQGHVNPLGRTYRKQYIAGRNALPGNCAVGYLSEWGYQQHVQNAALLRAAYGPFLPDINDPAQDGSWYFRSTDVPRTLQSGQALVDALWPPSNDTADGLQQVPWNTVDDGFDSILQPYEICPFAATVFANLPNDPVFLALFEQKALPTLTAYAGAVNITSDEYPTTNLGEVLDCAFTHVCPQTEYPAALNATIVAALDAINTWEFWYGLSSPFSNASGASVPSNQGLRANVGFLLADVAATIGTVYPSVSAPSLPSRHKPTLKDLLRAPNSLAAPPATPLKFALFSGHDTGPMFPILQAFGILPSEGFWPAYASLLTLELWGPPGSVDPTQASIRIVYKGKSWPLPFCPASADNTCPLPAFLEGIAAMMPTQDDCAGSPSAAREAVRAGTSKPLNAAQIMEALRRAQETRRVGPTRRGSA